MRQAGRYLPEYQALRKEAVTFLDLCYNAKLCAEATLQPIRRFTFDAAIIFSDILVVPDALGQEVRFIENEGPRLAPLMSERDIANLAPSRMAEHLRPVYDALRLVRTQLDRSTALIGFCGAPFTLASYMVGGGGPNNLSNARLYAKAHPERFATLLDLLAQVGADHLIAQVEAGADLVQVFDSWAGILDPDAFDRYGRAPMVTLVKRFRAACPKVPLIAFPKGHVASLERYVETVAPDALSVDWTVALGAIKSRFPGLVVQGNLDPLELIVGGESLERAVRKLLSEGGQSRFIVNLGHGVRPQTPIENVHKLVEIVRQNQTNMPKNLH